MRSQRLQDQGAHDFSKLPNDYNYQVQEGSSNISIGQRQLISFARTLVANPEILVLDEATSSVDAYTELVIQNALKTLMQNRMTIIIAHRLSTVRLCNEILIIDQGSIVERGTHEELMKRGLYSRFVGKQFREETALTCRNLEVVFVQRFLQQVRKFSSWMYCRPAVPFNPSLPS
jgi:ABC-type multidrug transport system fused ATPase/permease subunit